MKRLWLVLNTGSGSTSTAIVAEFEAACAGYDLVGRTDFPANPLPDTAALVAAKVDTLVVFGGDGTINAATCKVDDWDGLCLVLPGGTMNGLAKTLHGDAEWAVVLRAAPSGHPVTIPVAVSGEHRAMVGVIGGPAAAWFHAREYVRAGAYAKLGRALRFAMRKTFARTIRVCGDGLHPGRHRAVIITPRTDHLEIASVSSATWFAAARLGAQWLLGDWREADDVTVSNARSVALISSRRVSALFDGEAVKLPSPATIVHALTHLRFISTLPQ